MHEQLKDILIIGQFYFQNLTSYFIFKCPHSYILNVGTQTEIC